MDLLRPWTCSGLGPAQACSGLPCCLKKEPKGSLKLLMVVSLYQKRAKSRHLVTVFIITISVFLKLQAVLSLANDSLKFLLQRFLPPGRKRCSRNLKLLKESKNF